MCILLIWIGWSEKPGRKRNSGRNLQEILLLGLLAFVGWYRSRRESLKASCGYVDTEKVREILKEKGQVSAIKFICDTTDITILGAKNIVMKLKDIEKNKA